MTDAIDKESWYQFDESEIDRIASALDASAAVEDRAHHDLPDDTSARLNAKDPSEGLRRALAGIFFRGLRLDAENPARVQVRVYGDTVSSESLGDYLPPIQSASQDEVLLWRALADAVTHPLPKSLVHDLLFIRGDGDVGLHAREAIRLYMDAARTASLRLSTRVYSALRALTLIKLTRSVADVATVSQVLGELTALDLADETARMPGLTLPMVAAIVSARPTAPPSTPVSDLLEKVMARYGNADHIDYIAEIFRLSPEVSDVRKEEVRRARVTTRLERARSEKLLELKLFLFEKAASEAQRLGYGDLYDEAVAELQRVDTAGMNWVEIGSEVHYPPEIVAGYIGEFTSHGDWKRGLRQWLATDAPSGRSADNEDIARGSLEHSALQSLFPRFRVGSHGMPERTGTPDRPLEDKVRDVEYSHALIEGTLLFEALREIGLLAGNPSEEELSALLMQRYRCPAANATILAKAFILFWRSEYLVCAYFVTPFIEAGVRTLLLELNEPIYRVELGKTKGQYAPLGALLPRLEAEGFDPDWVRYLETLTVSDGQNYRNDIAHGFLRQMDPVVAVLLLRASSLFLTMPLQSATAAEISQLMQRPTRERPRRSLSMRIRSALTAARRAFEQ